MPPATPFLPPTRGVAESGAVAALTDAAPDVARGAAPAEAFPLLIALAGLPGAGKTTLSREVAGRLGAVWLRIDTVEGAMRRAGLSSETIGGAGYGVAMALAADHLAAGLAVVADSVNPVAASRAGWRTVAAAAGAPLLEVEVVCSDAAEHRRRVEERGDGVPGLPRVTWARVSDCGYEPWPGERLVVDTARLSPAEAADAVLAAVAASTKLVTHGALAER